MTAVAVLMARYATPRRRLQVAAFAESVWRRLRAALILNAIARNPVKYRAESMSLLQESEWRVALLRAAPDSACSQRLLGKLAACPFDWVRQLALANPTTRDQILSAHVNDLDADVLRAVASNPNASLRTRIAATLAATLEKDIESDELLELVDTLLTP